MWLKTKFEILNASTTMKFTCVLIDTERFASFSVIGKNLSIVHLDIRKICKKY